MNKLTKKSPVFYMTFLGIIAGGFLGTVTTSYYSNPVKVELVQPGYRDLQTPSVIVTDKYGKKYYLFLSSDGSYKQAKVFVNEKSDSIAAYLKNQENKLEKIVKKTLK